jgi:hypothetical protein
MNIYENTYFQSKEHVSFDKYKKKYEGVRSNTPSLHYLRTMF